MGWRVSHLSVLRYGKSTEEPVSAKDLLKECTPGRHSPHSPYGLLCASRSAGTAARHGADLTLLAGREKPRRCARDARAELR